MLGIMGSTASPLTGGQCSTRSGGEVAYMITNRGVNDAVVGYGMNSGAANGRTILGFPTVGGFASEGAFVVLARTQVVVTLTPNLWFFGSTSSGNSEIVVQPGDGA